MIIHVLYNVISLLGNNRCIILRIWHNEINYSAISSLDNVGEVLDNIVIRIIINDFDDYHLSSFIFLEVPVV